MSTIAIQGICYDDKSSYQRGPRLAPHRIREALHSGSMNYYTEAGNSMEPLLDHDLGDFSMNKYFDIEQITRDHLKQYDKVLSLGGDHSITYPIIQAYQERYPELAILHIDAHADLYQEFEGDPYSHACPFARIMENKLAVRLVQIGIRTLNPHQAEQVEKYGVEVHPMQDWALSDLPLFEQPVYLSLDLDGLDPAFAPGVSHHEPGGLSTRQVLDIIQNLQGPLVGADIVEYNPERDVQGMTAYLAAKLMKEILGKMLLH